jgi:hypothetical protein
MLLVSARNFLGGKSIELIVFVETGFVICDDPAVAEAAYNRRKYLNRILCWISPHSLYTSILNKQITMGPTLPLRVLTATLADRVAALVNTRQITSPNRFDQQVRIIDPQIISINHFREICMTITIQRLRLLLIH